MGKQVTIFGLLAAFVLIAVTVLAPSLTQAAPGREPLVLSGVIGPGAFLRFKAELDRRNPDVVVVDGPGGRVFEAVLIGTEIRRRGLSTVVPKNRSCASACTIVFLSGRTRSLQSGASLGLHAAADGGHAADPAGTKFMYGYLSRVGVSKDLAREMAAVPPNRVKWLNAAQQRALGVRVDR
jgi:hypothetical protein